MFAVRGKGSGSADPGLERSWLLPSASRFAIFQKCNLRFTTGALGSRSAFKVRGLAVTSSLRQPPRHPLAAVTPSALSMPSAPAGAASTKSAGMCPRGCERRLPSITFRVQGIRVSGSRVAGVMGQDLGSRFRDKDLGLRSHHHCHRRRVGFLAFTLNLNSEPLNPEP
jgi:hypothetical protein